MSISPNGDGVRDAASAWIELKYPSDVTIEVRKEGELVRTVPLGLLPKGQPRLALPGRLGRSTGVTENTS